jgi:hypothetical protein
MNKLVSGLLPDPFKSDIVALKEGPTGLKELSDSGREVGFLYSSVNSKHKAFGGSAGGDDAALCLRLLIVCYLRGGVRESQTLKR